MLNTQQSLPIEMASELSVEKNLLSPLSTPEEEAFTSVDDVNDSAIHQSAQVRSVWVTVNDNEQLHLKHFIPAHLHQPSLGEEHTSSLAGVGKSVFLLHGEAECGRVYFGSHGRGLAWELVRQGYEVFVADLGGRGRSIAIDGKSRLTVNAIVCEVIPALLKAAAQQSFIGRQGEVLTVASSSGHQPDIWIGHGFGAVLLAAAWSRMDKSLRSARRMVFINARRRLHSLNWQSKVFAKVFCSRWLQNLTTRIGRLPIRRFGLGTADENSMWLSTYADWLTNMRWVDLQDDYDYSSALQGDTLPPILHIAAKKKSYFSSPNDVRAFVDELGAHDARIIFVDKDDQHRRHNHLSLLLGGNGAREVFSDIVTWLDSTESFDTYMRDPYVELTPDLGLQEGTGSHENSQFKDNIFDGDSNNIGRPRAGHQQHSTVIDDEFTGEIPLRAVCL